MTRTQAKELLIKTGVSEPTEEQITTLLDSVTAETKSANDKIKSLKEKADKADELQKQIDESNEKDMTESEKANKALEEANKKIAELTSNTFKSEAKAILSKAGLDDADVEALLPGMVADTLENTTARANAYVSTISKVRESAIKGQQKKDLDDTPTPGGGQGGDGNKSEAAKYAESLVKSSGTETKDAGDIIGNYK